MGVHGVAVSARLGKMVHLQKHLLALVVAASISSCFSATVVVINETASHAIPSTLCKSSYVQVSLWSEMRF